MERRYSIKKRKKKRINLKAYFSYYYYYYYYLFESRRNQCVKTHVENIFLKKIGQKNGPE